MAGIAKIASKDFDEVNKINSAVLIGLGTALVAEVKTGETFYAGSTTLLTGTMDTVAIVAANDNYPAGYHAGDGGGLDAIDTDLAPGNIKKDVNIFGKVGTLESTITKVIEYSNQKLTENSTWITKGTFAIPAAASIVMHSCITINGDSSYQSIKARALYDGVEKNLVEDATARYGEHTWSVGQYAGTGSEATLNLQHWKGGGIEIQCAGSAFYAT